MALNTSIWPKQFAVMLCAFAFVAGAAQSAFAASPLTWAGRVLVDGPDGTNQLRAVSCVAPHFCAAVDASGKAVRSNKPNGGAAAWKRENIDGTNALRGIACRPLLCVAVDSSGNALTLTSPANLASAWSAPVAVDSGKVLTGVSCPSASLCVAVDGAGQVITSNDPTGGASKWTAALVDTGKSLDAVSCPSASFCAAVDNKGNALTSTNPTGGAAQWTLHAAIDSSNSIDAVSCTSASLCVAIDEAGNVLTTTTPTGSAAWKAVNIVPLNSFYTLFGVSCPTTSLCVVVNDNGDAITSTNPTGGAAAWKSANIDSRWGFYGVSCASIALCVAVDAGGNAQVGRLPLAGTRITKVTINKTTHKASFSFAAIGTASGFQCKLRKNGAKVPFSSCHSPKTYTNLGPGSYAFYVRAVNSSGVDPTPAGKSFGM